MDAISVFSSIWRSRVPVLLLMCMSVEVECLIVERDRVICVVKNKNDRCLVCGKALKPYDRFGGVHFGCRKRRANNRNIGTRALSAYDRGTVFGRSDVKEVEM